MPECYLKGSHMKTQTLRAFTNSAPRQYPLSIESLSSPLHSTYRRDKTRASAIGIHTLRNIPPFELRLKHTIECIFV